MSGFASTFPPRATIRTDGGASFRKASALMRNREGSYPGRISCLEVEAVAVTKDHFGTVKLPSCFDSGAVEPNH